MIQNKINDDIRLFDTFVETYVEDFQTDYENPFQSPTITRSNTRNKPIKKKVEIDLAFDYPPINLYKQEQQTPYDVWKESMSQKKKL